MLFVIYLCCGFKPYNNIYTKTSLNSRHSNLDYVFVKNIELITSLTLIAMTIADHSNS